jgi:hypothetical protein
LVFEILLLPIPLVPSARGHLLHQRRASHLLFPLAYCCVIRSVLNFDRSTTTTSSGRRGQILSRQRATLRTLQTLTRYNQWNREVEVERCWLGRLFLGPSLDLKLSAWWTVKNVRGSNSWGSVPMLERERRKTNKDVSSFVIPVWRDSISRKRLD